jgi:SAM-dependent MidA family methyltransferase
LPFAAQAQKLLSPAEMGELFKAVAFGKDFDGPLLGFASGDKRRTL